MQLSNNNRQSLLRLARTGWGLALILTLSLYIMGIPARYAVLRTSTDWRSLVNLSLSANSYANLAITIDFLFILIHTAIAALIFWRRKDDWMALFVALALVINGSMVPLIVEYEGATPLPVVQLGLNIVFYLGLVSSSWLLYLFPTGHFVPRSTAVLAVMWGVLCFPIVFFPDSPLSILRLPTWAQILILLMNSGVGVIAQVYRYQKESSLLHRQQVKWGIFGLTAAALGPFTYFLPYVILPSFTQQAVPNILYQRMGASFFSASQISNLFDSLGFNMLAVVFPLSFAIAILRYRLWEIDLIIRRTLVYSILTALLALIYLSGVTLFQSLFSNLRGGESGAEIVLSTLAIANLFNPLRKLIQAYIDRRFYRRKYDAEQALAEFAAAARSHADLSQLTDQLGRVVQDTMQPEQIALWLCSTTDRSHSKMI